MRKQRFFSFMSTLVLLLVFQACEKPVELANVNTSPVTSIESITAIAGGTITSDGGGTITSRGVCWSLHNQPTVNDSKIECGKGIGNFECTVSELSPNTTYFICAYATNPKGTAYGSVVTFTTIASLPEVETLPCSEISESSVRAGGIVWNDGGAALTSGGICWSKAPLPTRDNSMVEANVILGEFYQTVNGLEPNTKYYIRAFATNTRGTSYGNEEVITTLEHATLPEVRTDSVAYVASTSVSVVGTLLSNGGSSQTSYGVCWSTSQTPTVTDNLIAASPSSGTYRCVVVELQPNTNYYFRAYATNRAGTTYGEPHSATTTQLLTDADGNSYGTVSIGKRIWMQENLNVTKYNDGENIPKAESNETWSTPSPAYCEHSNNTNNRPRFGLLYNWHAVATAKLCPTGWNVPTDDEWTELANALGGASFAGGKLKEAGMSNWKDPNTGATNETLFTALPGGTRSPDGTFYSLNEFGFWWSSSAADASNAFYHDMGYDYSKLCREYYLKGLGASVRCIKD